MAIKRICQTIVRDEKSILPVSSLVTGEYGINDVVLSLPAIVGKDGVEKIVPIQFNEEELNKLNESAEFLSSVARKQGY